MAAAKVKETQTASRGFITRLRAEVVDLRLREQTLQEEITVLAAEREFKERLLFEHSGTDVDMETLGAPEGTLVDGIRVYFEAHPGPAPVKDIVQWLIYKGYRTEAKEFYQSVYSTMKAMRGELMFVVKQGRTTQFIPKDQPTPPGWRKVEIPMRKPAYQKKVKMLSAGGGGAK